MKIFLRFIVTCYLCSLTSPEIIPVQFGGYFNRELLARIPNLSLKSCEQECRARGVSCSGISYRRKAHLCFIHGQEELTVPYDTTSGMLYSNASEWRTPPSNNCGNSTCGPHMKCEENNCRIVKCGKRASLTNAEIKGNMGDVGSTVRYYCKEGFNAIGAVTDFRTVCFPNISWSPLNLEVCSNSYKQHTNIKILQSYNFISTDIFTGITLAECLRRCDLTTRYCIGANYRQGTCELASDSIRTNVGTVTHINASGWIAVEKLLPVFLTTGPTYIRYTLSFFEAQQACSSLGTRLATYAELLSAYQNGYNICACGWVQENKAYIVMHYNITSCVKEGITACSWQTKWNAFCANVH